MLHVCKIALNANMKTKSTGKIEPVLTYGALVGQVLQQLRKGREIDQGLMAQAVGLSQSAYSRIESGETAIALVQLRKAGDYLRCPPSEILAQADQFERQLVQQGVRVVAERDVDPGGALIGVAILLALFGAAS